MLIHMHTVDDYLRFLADEKRYSRLTVQGYRRDLGFFIQFARAAREPEVEPAERAPFDPAVVDRNTVRGYLRTLYDEGLLPASIQRRVAAVRSYFAYLVKRGDLVRDPSARVATPRPRCVAGWPTAPASRPRRCTRRPFSWGPAAAA